MTTISRTIVLWFALIVLALPRLAMAFPAAPLPMYELWKRSEIVVYADVHSEKSDNGKQFAVVSVVKVLKGDKGMETKTISVFTHLGGCPYPHTFEVNERVIVFLEYDNEELMYTPVGTFEAVIATDVGNLKEYSRAFDDLPAIFSVPEEKGRKELLLRWSIKYTLNPVTRRDGFASLAWAIPQNTKPGDWLQPEELSELLDTIFAESEPDQVLPLIGLLDELPSKQLNELLMTSLSNCHETGWRDTARHTLQVLPKRLQVSLSPTMEAQLKDYWKLESEYYYGDIGDENERSDEEKEVRKSSLDIKFGWICARVCGELSPGLQLR